MKAMLTVLAAITFVIGLVIGGSGVVSVSDATTVFQQIGASLWIVAGAVLWTASAIMLASAALVEAIGALWKGKAEQ